MAVHHRHGPRIALTPHQSRWRSAWIYAPNVSGIAPQKAFREAGSVGRPVRRVEHRSIDAEGRVPPPGDLGELILRGGDLMAR